MLLFSEISFISTVADNPIGFETLFASARAVDQTSRPEQAE
jgi:hypothetical protein